MMGKKKATKSELKRQFVGKWRIIKMSEWDREYCDMEVKAYILIEGGGSGEFQFGLVSGSICGDFKKIHEECLFDFTWEGNEEYDAVSGDGWMEIRGNGTAEGEIRFHGGDKSMFWAKKATCEVKARKGSRHMN